MSLFEERVGVAAARERRPEERGTRRPRRSAVALLLLSVFSSIAACGGGDGATPSDPAAGQSDPALETKTREAIASYVVFAHARYAKALDEARALRDAIDAFLEAPSEAGLVAARAAWIAARSPYGETEAFRFFGGPIDDDENGPEGRINGWPLDEAYVDYTVGNDAGGIVNHPDQYPTITRDVLVDANEKDGEANVSTGYHAIEFLLWGQDLSETGPGARPFTDYTTAPNAVRRREYLRVVTDLLVDDLAYVVDGWDEAKEASFARKLRAIPPAEALAKAFRGMVMLAGLELSRERMGNAFHKGEQEEEHSCFSDNTTADLLANARAIEGVYTNGGIGDVVASKDAAVDADVRQKLAAAIDAISAIPAPFDRAIVDLSSRPKVEAAMKAVDALTDSLSAAATKVGVVVNIEQK